MIILINKRQYIAMAMVFVIILLSWTTILGQSQLIDKVSAKVGGEMILLSDIEARVSYIRDNYGLSLDDTRCIVIQDLIAQKILINQAKLDSVVITDEEVNAQIDARIDQILTMMGNDVERFEKEYGRTVAEVRRDQQENLRNTMYTQRMRNQVMSDVQASPTEVVEFFHSIPSDSLPFFNSEVELSEIVYRPKASEESREKAVNTLNRLRTTILEDSTAFARLAKLYSEDPGSADKGGDLGWQKRGSFVAEFEAAAYNLAQGEISDVIESDYGYHLIQMLERRGNVIHTRHILIKPAIFMTDVDSARAELLRIREAIVSDSITFEQAVRQYGYDKTFSYNNGGRMTNQNSGTTYFEIGDLDSDVFFAIDNLKVGDISDPVLFDRRNEDILLKIYKLDSRSEPHKASLSRDYAQIQKLATEYKREKLFNDWLFDRVQQTYIEIDPAEMCPDLETWLITGKAE